MTVRIIRRPLTLRQALVLIAVGVVVGYPSWVNLDIWGSGSGRYQGLCVFGLFIATLALISGVVALVAVGIRSLVLKARTRNKKL